MNAGIVEGHVQLTEGRRGLLDHSSNSTPAICMQAGVCILEPARTPHRTFEPGIAAGVASALLLARVMERLLFHIDPFDTATFFLIPAFLLAVCICVPNLDRS